MTRAKLPASPAGIRFRRTRRASLGLTLVLLGLPFGHGTVLRAADSAPGELAPLILKLPAPKIVGTPPESPPAGTTVEKPTGKPAPPMLIPKNAINVAPKSAVTCSDTNVSAAKLAKLTDGDKEARDESTILLRKGTQYVQFDLGSPHEIFAVAVWHAFDSPKIYRDVILQVADDAGFTNNVRTLFNNDQDNSSGRGAGTDREYYETHEGKIIDAKGAKARFVRLYSKGSTESALNEYGEVEIYARPAK